MFGCKFKRLNFILFYLQKIKLTKVQKQVKRFHPNNEKRNYNTREFQQLWQHT